MRYAFKSLQADIEMINNNMREIKAEYRYVAIQMNGATSLYIATPEQAARHCTQQVIEVGTPRQCQDAMYKDAYYQMRGAVDA